MQSNAYHALTNKPGLPTFANDIYPILKRALDIRFASAFAFATGDHDTLSVFAPPGGPGDTLPNRQAIYDTAGAKLLFSAEL